MNEEQKKPYIIGWDWFRKDYSEHKYEIGFFGSCFGVTLGWRGAEDPHVVFTIVCEDDGNWSVKTEGSASTGWLHEVIRKLEEAQAWCDEHCVKEKYGYVFKGNIEVGDETT